MRKGSMWKRTLRSVRYAALGAFLSLAGYYGHSVAIGNFRTVTEGTVYRSAQLSESRLERYLDEYGIRSVVNLRGAEPGVAWYDDELRVCRERGVRHYNVKLSAVSEPDAAAIETLLRTFAEAPRPLLLHCHGGADRSGFAAALWKAGIEGVGCRAAKKQLTALYGHIPWGPWARTRAMDRAFERWCAEREHAAGREQDRGKTAPGTRGESGI